jgi:hypothetical protein
MGTMRGTSRPLVLCRLAKGMCNGNAGCNAISDLWTASPQKTGVGGGVPQTCGARAIIDVLPPYSGGSQKSARPPARRPISRRMPRHDSARAVDSFNHANGIGGAFTSER